ncbi:MAG: hypothetical protein E6Z03_01540 [Negativicoccus succinicivorans]|uniref:hypothetical protein n=1 Tax=Negativicoccus succinicivorans TaxID=620903 RepID=UPI002911030D|nr:hypothetical protein [Negativicoccus succinicivorans]MDU5942784.1 hypothetical protein [Negativicoccus succinicivorans]
MMIKRKDPIHWTDEEVTKLVNSKIQSHTTLKLVNKLREIWDNPHFPLIAIRMENDEQRQKLLDIIEKENLTDTDEIIYTALDISDGYI